MDMNNAVGKGSGYETTDIMVGEREEKRVENSLLTVTGVRREFPLSFLLSPQP